MEIENIVIPSEVIAMSLEELCPATVPTTHSFQLGTQEAIYHRCRRMPPQCNEIIYVEIQRMLEAGIIHPASFAWPFPIIIASKKDGKPRLCVYYRKFNQLMIPDL